MRLKLAFGLIAAASFVVLPVLGAVTQGSDYHITEQNEQLTTDIPNTSVVNAPADVWTINLASGLTAHGTTTVPEPSGETGQNQALGITFGSLAVIQVSSEL